MIIIVLGSAHKRKLLSMPPAAIRTASEITSLLDGVAVATRAFTLLRRPVDHWDDWLVEIVTSRLDRSIREDWEKTLEGKDDLPTYKDLSTFLENRARTLDAASGNASFTTNQSSSPYPPPYKKVHNKNNKPVSAYHSPPSAPVDKPTRPPPGCTLCKGRHFLAYCLIFLKMDASRKRDYTGESRTCRNCLRVCHFANGVPLTEPPQGSKLPGSASHAATRLLKGRELYTYYSSVNEGTCQSICYQCQRRKEVNCISSYR